MKQILANIEVPSLYTTENDNDPIVKIHFINPNGRGDWFVTEGKEESNGDWTFFGFVRSVLTPMYDELGYFTLNELESNNMILDSEWKEKPLSQAKQDAIKIEALEAIIADKFKIKNFFIYNLCVGMKDIVKIRGVENLDTHICGTYEGETLWINKIELLKMMNVIEQLM